MHALQADRFSCRNGCMQAVTARHMQGLPCTRERWARPGRYTHLRCLLADMCTSTTTGMDSDNSRAEQHMFSVMVLRQNMRMHRSPPLARVTCVLPRCIAAACAVPRPATG